MNNAMRNLKQRLIEVVVVALGYYATGKLALLLAIDNPAGLPRRGFFIC
jgi:hypothetical protein